VRYLRAQLLITAVSLPILVNAGLPISAASLIGNFLFVPLITIFLTLSSVLFFTELCGIPNDYIVAILEFTTKVFENALNYGNKNWLIGFTQTSLYLLVPVAIIALLIIKNRKPTVMLSGLLLSVVIPLYLFQYPVNLKVTPKLILEGTTLTDYGEFNKKGNPQNFVNFELKSYLTKKLGTPSIKKLVITKPGIRSFKASLELCKNFDIDTVTVHINKKLSKYAWRCYFDLKRQVESNDGIVLKEKKRRIV